MAKFVFRFEALLKHRQHIEDQRQRELAQQMRGRMILQDQLRTMQDTIRSNKRELGSALVGRVDVESIAQFARFTGHTTIRAQQIVRRLAEFEKHIEAARQNLLAATRQRKALELLRDRQLEEWRREQTRREALELDEIANQRYARSLMVEGAR